ncbi:CBS domain-containing protein [Thiosulfativibrio zosterae]|uniref:CBS domain-containing protein n=1 Tax=Thiosulfativibrio zosterae TaxID=2675053 RepID=A0A6F8PMR4_9GAMM|nr:CBS domain-containing protein [Thiosulfativibrio zosterae]BBP43290.1 hypothetical protein THMIRHAT_10360 [Thiosulfativibrio zosterae]
MMFMVYSPEGSNAVSPGQLHAALKVDPSKKVNPVQRSELEQMHLEAEDAAKKQLQNRAALKHYQSTQNVDHERHIVVKAFEIMSQPVVTVDKRMSIADAWQFMQAKKIHHLPVLENQQLIGLCSSSCILSRAILDKTGALEEIKNETVEQVMVKEVVTTHRNMDIRKIALVMSEYGFGCLPIMSETESILGIVTLSDIVRRVAAEPPLGLYA